MEVLDRNAVAVLDRAECMRLLANGHVGRVGLSIGALPVILPVSYVLDGGRIVFRSSGGTKLDQALRGAVVCFEVDDVDPTHHAGWSVLVTGRSSVVTDAEDLARADALPLRRWGGDGDHVVEIRIELVSGRHIA